jgi:hypothetical protein
MPPTTNGLNQARQTMNVAAKWARKCSSRQGRPVRGRRLGTSEATAIAASAAEAIHLEGGVMR